MEKRSPFFRNLTFRRVIFYLFIAFLIYILIDILMDPQGAFESFKAGYYEEMNR